VPKRKDYAPDTSGPLHGVRVLDLSQLFAGNVLTQMLADFGADVIKVEPLGGDTLRQWKVENVDTHWQAYCRNKRSLCLNFRESRAIALIKLLIADADMLIESFRPGVLEEIGLAPSTLLAINPRLCIGRISGWGQTGPYARRPGFGTIIEGFSGFASMNGHEDREPLLPPMYLADGLAGIHGAAAMMFALREVEVNQGHGQIVDLSLLDPLLALLGPQAANYALTGKVKPRTGSRSTNSAPRNVYRCADGHLHQPRDLRRVVAMCSGEVSS
jgi:crotonobetainyl-CoA:carnitine CoA-transferase CaiB-like acyl-CoA transferase